MKASIARALTWCLLVVALSAGMKGAPAMPAPEDPDGPKSRPTVASSPRGVSHADLLVEVRSVLRRLEKGDPLVLVDVRSPKAFGRLRIPGSLNIPLQFIRTKPFLKTTPMVLVNQGFGLQALAGECQRLQPAGYSVSILNGGLCAWHGAGGPLEGDLGAAAEFSRVTPQDAYLEKDAEFRLVVDVSGVRSQTSREAFPHAVHVPLEENSVLVLKRLQAALDQRPDARFSAPLILSESGHAYDRVEQVLGQAGFESVFFLAGGITAYRRYLADLSRLWPPRESRVRTLSPCPACGDGDGRGAGN